MYAFEQDVPIDATLYARITDALGDDPRMGQWVPAPDDGPARPMSTVANASPRPFPRLPARALMVALVILAAAGVEDSTAGAATTCDPANDVCVVAPDSVQTPLGLITVSTTPNHVVTVHLDPTTSNTWVIGIPFPLPPGPLRPGCPGGCARTTLDTTGGLVVVDTIVPPTGSASRYALPNLAVISLIPPGPPCRVSTVGMTVTFTPVIPPGPPA